MTSLLSVLLVLLCFLPTYSSVFHTPRSLSSLQNILYKRWRLLSFEDRKSRQGSLEAALSRTVYRDTGGSEMVQAAEEHLGKSCILWSYNRNIFKVCIAASPVGSSGMARHVKVRNPRQRFPTTQAPGRDLRCCRLV